MTNTTHQDETEQLLAFLTRPEQDETIDPSLTSTSTSSNSSSSTARPLNFSSAFSQSSSNRPRRSSALAASHNISQSFLPQSTIENFGDFNFLPQPPEAEEEEEIVAGPGPNSIAAAVARNGIQGLEQFQSQGGELSELPIPPPLPQPQTSQIEGGEKKKRGRPRTRAVKDPNQPPKKRGRPRKDHPLLPSPPPPQPLPLPQDQSNQSVVNLDPFIQYEEGSQSGGEGTEGEYESSDSASSSVRDGDATSNEKEKKNKKKKKKKGRKLIEPPLIPRVFRKGTRPTFSKESEIGGGGEVADLDVHDLIESRTREEENEKVPVEEEELTEEQKRELQRALNPDFTTRLLTTLEEHSREYARAYKALQEELLAVQIEESLLEHVKEVALEMRNNIRYPLKTIEEIQQLEPTSRS